MTELPDIRVATPVPFPAMVTGSGPITLSKLNGVWQIGYNVMATAQQTPPTTAYPHDYLLYYDAVAGTYSRISLQDLAAAAGGGGGLTPIANDTVLGNVSGASAIPTALTQAQLTALIQNFTSTTAGDVPASGGGTANFLRADGIWATPAGTGGGTVNSVAMTVPAGLAVAGSPITNTGTLALSWSGTIPAAQVPTFSSSANGGVSASGGGTTNFLRADGTWAAPPGGGGGAGSPFVYQNSNFSGTNLTGYLVDTTSAALTVTLPASPAVGAWLQLMDAGGTWGAHNLTVNGNGANINSSSSNLTLNLGGSVVLLSYVNSTIGWKAFTL